MTYLNARIILHSHARTNEFYTLRKISTSQASGDESEDDGGNTPVDLVSFDYLQFHAL